MAQQVEEYWHLLSTATTFDAFKAVRGALAKAGQLSGLADFSDAQIWAVIEEKNAQSSGNGEESPSDLKTPEWAVFSNPSDAPTSPDFQLRTEEIPSEYEKYFSNIRGCRYYP